MSAQEEPQVQRAQEQQTKDVKDIKETRPETPDSLAASDKDTDTFEDAVDTGSVRSLTNRKVSSLQSTRPSSGATDETAISEDLAQQPKRTSEEGDGDTVRAESEDVVPTDPIRISKPISNPPSLHNIDLDDEASTKPLHSVDLDDEAATKPLHNVDLNDEVTGKPKEKPLPSSKKLSLSNITASFPAMPWTPSSNPESPPKGNPPALATTAAPTQPTPPAPPSRKFTSPFSWMSRSSNSKEPAGSPPTTDANSPRRNTASSVATLTSNPEMMLSKLDEENENSGTNGGRNPARNSLRDRFKIVRMREEAGIALEGEHDGSTLGITSPAGENGHDLVPTSPLPLTPNPALAPGTVSGISAGPSAMADDQVDWDLWQSVVYEGPAAVARTSPEELNKAIATGIPNVIRGVVWQVLAQSKNEELEMTYKQLASRGNEKNRNRNSNATSVSSLSNGNGTLSSEKEPVASSASSVHSEQSGGSGVKSPPSADTTEAALKAQALSAAERKKKEKEDAANLLKLERTIRKDMGTRTSFSKHAAAAGLQEGLFGVCKAYALFDEGVGYAQGMNFLVMPLLFNMPEEEAFCILVRLMNHHKLRDLFIQDMPGLHLRLYQFERLLEDLEPALYCHLHRRGISSHLYATQWFLTLFAYRFPLQLVLRIYDLIFSEGLEAILRFGVVLMQKNASTLLGMSDMAELTGFLKEKVFDIYIDQAPSAGSILENGFFGSSSSSIDKEVYRADQLVRDACDVKLTPELLKIYTAEWEAKTRIEKDREEELQQLKTTNLSYAIKIRKLEERLEASDRESTAMATDLVQTKVQNEELSDQNESLLGQVKELRNVIEKQPEELEQAWQLERDDLMKRNEKVHEENRRLEKELSELEEELVQTKMRYAEINSQHETLQRKWADLKRQFA
ncbi:hypothetical protein DL762_007522 [Monosporascus cannonballus]|uniref:Rab-GAP TBC domain-containing protein n=1 Tax=Monosporascus cannonballus TaxID=155416 RepID=A0ABY0H3B9_9PEZI|nr:hypothetical protein DL762_007522 [Monosporascus cannonballus]